VELRHLRYFVAVCETLHFGEAARKLRIAQPSLSLQIQQLEAEVRATLLRRTRRRVELTEAGQLFLEEARDILARADRAALIARRAGIGDGGRLRVGVGYCMDQRALVRAAASFHDLHPRVRIELQTMAVPAQISALQDQRLDVGFLRSTVNEGLSSDVVVTEPLVVALPRGHRFAGSRAIVLSRLCDDDFVVTSREFVPVYHDIVLRACREAGFVPHALHEPDQLQMLLLFVSMGCGVALVPAFAQRLRTPRVRFAALRPTSPMLETVVAWRRQNESAMLGEFVSIARRILARSAHPRKTGRHRLGSSPRRSHSSGF
jgi:DNA-binding transcriptional LysR family regulator